MVASARGSDALPFTLSCDQLFKPDAAFCSRVRQALAAADPRRIAQSTTFQHVDGNTFHREVDVDLQGDPFRQLVIRNQTNVGPVVWRQGTVVAYQQMQPIIN